LIIVYAIWSGKDDKRMGRKSKGPPLGQLVRLVSRAGPQEDYLVQSIVQGPLGQRIFQPLVCPHRHLDGNSSFSHTQNCYRNG